MTHKQEIQHPWHPSELLLKVGIVHHLQKSLSHRIPISLLQVFFTRCREQPLSNREHSHLLLQRCFWFSFLQLNSGPQTRFVLPLQLGLCNDLHLCCISFCPKQTSPQARELEPCPSLDRQLRRATGRFELPVIIASMTQMEGTTGDSSSIP